MVDLRLRKAVNVHIVTNNTVHVTRRDILKWLGGIICKDLKRVEDLANGSIYCIVMNQLFPGCIPIHKIKVSTRSESEAISNFKLLTNAFRALEVKKDIPMESLAKGVFSENFRFAQWFKLFYDANSRYPQLFEAASDQEPEPSVTRRDNERHIRRSNSINNRSGWKNNVPHTLQDVSLDKRPPPVPTLQSGRASLPKQIHSNNVQSRPNGVKDIVSTKADSEDVSDMISVDPSDISTSDEYHMTKCAKAASSWVELKTDIVPTEQPTVSKADTKSPVRASKSTPSPRRRDPTPQLPPPSPSPSHYSTATSRFARRPTPQSNDAGVSTVKNLQAAGDRPVQCESRASGARRGTSPHQKLITGSDHSAGERLQESSEDEEESTKPSSHGTAAPETRSVNRFTGNENVNCAMSSNASTATQARCSLHVPSMREIEMSRLSSSEIASESELQRELAILRYGTIEQRRALFFCQKEAQFYFKKLLKIEELCQQLERSQDKAQKKIINTIFGILYETEDGFMCPDEIHT